MYYCTCCDTVYDPIAYVALKKHGDTYNDLVFCPNRGCEGSIIDVDENFILLMHELNELGVNTMFCCSGHPWEIKNNHLCMYLCYDAETDIEETGFVKEFTNQLLKMSNTAKYSFLHIEISTLPEEKIQMYYTLSGADFYTNTKVAIYMDIQDVFKEHKSMLQRNSKLLRLQATFLDAMNIAIERTIKVLEKPI